MKIAIKLGTNAIFNQENQLIKECGHGGDDMFAKGRARIADAYRERARQVSYRKPPPQNTGPVAAE